MYRGRCLPQRTEQTPSRQRVLQPNARLFTQLDLKDCGVSIFCYQHLIPIKIEYILMNQFWRGLTDLCFCSSGIPLSQSHDATPLRLLVGCQPLPSRSHARSCFLRIL